MDYNGVQGWAHAIFTWEDGVVSAPDLKEVERLAFSSSPNAWIATLKPPVLLVHGDDDRDVPFIQTVSLAQNLRRQEVLFEEIVYPNEVHDFLLWTDFLRSFSATPVSLQQHPEAQ